jgi:hypothetical protein
MYGYTTRDGKPVRKGMRVYVWSGMHATYLGGTVVSIAGRLALVVSQLGTKSIPIDQLITEKPKGYD